MVALYRPGPMEWIPDYIAGKHGRKKVEYLHPKLQPILDKTYGVAIYQEQVMEIARALAGFTMGGADVLRKAMGKKIAELLAQQKEKFIEGCVKNGISKELARKRFFRLSSLLPVMVLIGRMPPVTPWSDIRPPTLRLIIRPNSWLRFTNQ
jgi:DNA polymerase III subunit alpha